MLYVQQSLAQGEELIHIGRFHWFYDVAALMNIFWGLFFAVGLLSAAVTAQEHLPFHITTIPLTGDESWLDIARMLHPGIKLVAVLLFLIGLFRCTQMLVIKVTTEIAITSERIIYKRGLVARYVAEMNIDRIEGVSVLQTVMGRLFGFGRILVRGMGVGEMILPPIANPISFRRAIEYARKEGEIQNGRT